MENEPPLQYASPPRKEPLGCLGALMAISTILQFTATAVFTLDLFDYNWYMVAALMIMLAAPVWLGGIICILITVIRRPGKFQQLLPLSILAHTLSAASVLILFVRYNH